MTKKTTCVLAVVVPVSNMSGQLQNLESWIMDASVNKISVILVHDKRDEQTSIELRQLKDRINSDLIELYEDHFDGPGAARNFGLSRVQTEWVAFWDSDDIPNLEITLSAINMADPKTNSIVSDYEIFNTGSGLKHRMQTPSNLVELACQAGIWRYCFRTERAKKSKFGDSAMGEDQVFLARLDLSSNEIQFNSETSYTYVRGSKSQLTNNPRKIIWLQAAIEEYLDIYAESPLNNILSISIGMRMSLTLIKSGSLKQKMHGMSSIVEIVRISKNGKFNAIGILKEIILQGVLNAKQR
jgi:glycosyltransferase involved in cell wall biosynthesis